MCPASAWPIGQRTESEQIADERSLALFDPPLPTMSAGQHVVSQQVHPDLQAEVVPAAATRSRSGGSRASSVSRCSLSLRFLGWDSVVCFLFIEGLLSTK